MAVHIQSLFHALCEILSELQMDLLEVTGQLYNQIFSRQSYPAAVGSRRSFVRMIASKLPRRPAKRCHFSVFKNGQFVVGECKAIDNGARILTCDRCGSSSCDTVNVECGGFMELSQGLLQTACGPCTGTPVHRCCSHVDARALLEAVCQLTDPQFRFLQEQRAKIRSKCSQHRIASIPGTCSKGVMPAKKLFTTPVIPPPPPLPSQPIYISTKTELIHQQPDQMIEQSKMKPELHPETFKQVMNLPELLQDLRSVKLRKTEKSPGGTPLRSKVRWIDPNDPAAIIEMALKKRFAHLQVLEETPENSENEETDDM